VEPEKRQARSVEQIFVKIKVDEQREHEFLHTELHMLKLRLQNFIYLDLGHFEPREFSI